MVTSQQKHS